MITFTDGDMWAFPAQIRVNTVNCVGVMGKGIAEQFKSRYPQMFDNYKSVCGSGELRPGYLHIWQGEGVIVVNFPTKRHWRNDSLLKDIRFGLTALRGYLARFGADVTVTIPPLGCGNGNLKWEDVKPLITEHLDGLNCNIVVFNPKVTK